MLGVAALRATPVDEGTPVRVVLQRAPVTHNHDAVLGTGDGNIEPTPVAEEADTSVEVGAHGRDEYNGLLTALEAVNGPHLQFSQAALAVGVATVVFLQQPNFFALALAPALTCASAIFDVSLILALACRSSSFSRWGAAPLGC